MDRTLKCKATRRLVECNIRKWKIVWKSLPNSARNIAEKLKNNSSEKSLIVQEF